MRYVFTDTFILCTLVNGACKGCLVIPQDTRESHLRCEQTRHNIELYRRVSVASKSITPIFQPTTTDMSIPIDAFVAIYVKMKLRGLVIQIERERERDIESIIGMIFYCGTISANPLHGPMSAKLWFNFNRVLFIHMIPECKSTINVMLRVMIRRKKKEFPLYRQMYK